MSEPENKTELASSKEIKTEVKEVTFTVNTTELSNSKEIKPEISVEGEKDEQQNPPPRRTEMMKNSE